MRSPYHEISRKASVKLTALRYLLAAFSLIFLVEFAITLALMGTLTDALANAAILAVIATPAIHFMCLRPLQAQRLARKRDEEKLIALREAVESMQIGVTVTDLEGRILYCNEAEAEMHGYTVEELLGREARVLSPQSRWRRLVPEEIRDLESWKRERINIRKDGSSFLVQLTSNVVRNAEGELIGLITNCEDITERKAAELALEESEARYRSLVESTEDSIYLVDENLRYVYVNKKHLKRLGVPEADIIGKTYQDFHEEEETKAFIKKVGRVFHDGTSLQHEHKSSRDGRYFLRTLSPVKDASGDIVAVTVISKEISEMKRLEEELRTLSLTDELTGLYNRRGLMTLGEQQLRMAKRLGRGLFILYADLDDLKAINDKFGHNEGDRLLVMTAELLNNTFRSADIIARIGGDEFVCLPVATDEATAEAMKARLSEGIAQANARKDVPFKLSLSFGLSFYDPLVPSSLEDLLAEADKSMYELKRSKP